MKTISPALQAHLDGELTTLADLVKITRADGVVKAFTSHDADLVVDGVTYVADGSFAAHAFDNAAALKADSAAIEGILDSALLSENEIKAGLYDHARIDVYVCNWSDPAQGVVPLRRGWLGEVRLAGGRYVAELRGLHDLLQRTVGDTYTPECRYDLGDARCGVNVAALTVAGSVSGVADRVVFTDAARTEAAGVFNYGKLVWTSGANTGLSMEVQNWDAASRTFTLWLPMPNNVAGNIVWASSLIETAHENQVGGGKGGALGGGGTRTTYSYSLHCAVAICSGVIGGIATIWADSKVIYQNGVWKTGVVGNATVYAGTATQDVDPLMESMIGAGQVPAYRGVAYIVLESLQLADFGSRLPNLTFEVLPQDIAPEPTWLGVVDAGVNFSAVTMRNGGMPPLTIEGGSSGARRVLMGGYTVTGATATFTATAYDVTGDVPVEQARTQSAGFAVSDVGDHSWALAPDGRFVALCLQDASTTPTHRLALYDVENRQFGALLSLNLPAGNDPKRVAWIDAQHFVLTDVAGGKRGLRVLARAGLSVVDLGFFDVWGAGSAAAMKPLYYAQFTPLADGLLHYAANTSPYFTAIYVRPVYWQGNRLVVGAAYTLVSGVATGSGSGVQAHLIPTGDGEWTLFYASTIDMRMMSFRPGVSSAIVTRPWQILVNASFSLAASQNPVVFGDRIVVVQRSYLENIYRLSEIALNDSGFALVVDGVEVAGCSSPLVDFGAAALDGARLFLMGLSGFEYRLSQFAIVRRRPTGDRLDAIVAGLLARAGYDDGDVDVTALADVPVDGYVMAEPMTAAAALAPLQLFEPFDLVESGARLKAVKHGGAAVVSVAVTEMRASDKAAAEPLREQARAQELDLPVEVTVDYLDASRDYEVGSQRARRSATRGARMMAKLRLPLVCSAARAKQIAEERLFAAWAERDQVTLRLSRRWLALEPGDVVNLGDRLLRVARVRRQGGLLEVQGALIAASPVNSAAQADSGALSGGVSVAPVASVLYLMDLPLLRSADDQPGVYAAVSGIAGWPGASLWRSPDAVNFSNVAGFSVPAIAGIAVTALVDGPSLYMDRAGTVQVQMLQGSLASCGEADLLNGANVAFLGGELIQFQTATLAGPGLYALSNLLRGRRGTESAMATHVVGEGFVVLTPGTVQFLPAALADRGNTHMFRALSNGQSLGAAADVALTYGMATLRPLAPAHVAGVRSGGDLIVTWTRRARLNGEWIDNVDVPLDEPVELYDVEIMNGGSVLRTFAGVTAANVTYTAAQQSADWGGSIPAQFSVRVYQLSARYGRGQAASAVV